MTKIYVVMGNDYPSAVFSKKKRAEKYCDRMRENNKLDGQRIFWRVYEFEVDKSDAN